MLRSSIDPSPPRARLRPRRAVALALVTTALLGSPTDAVAQDDTTAEDLVQESIRLRREGKDEMALEVLRHAERMQPGSVRILLHMSTAAQAAGHWLEADEYIRRVYERAEDPYFRRYESDIATVRQQIEARIGRLQVLGTPAGAEVRLNGHAVGTLPMAEPYRVEAGVYQLEIVSPGHFTVHRSERIPGGVLTREVVALDPNPVATGGGTRGGAARAEDWWREPWVGWTLAGVGAASLLGAGVAFAVREKNAAEWNDDGRCVVPGGGTREQTCGDDYGTARVAERIGIATTVGAVLFGSAAVLQLQFLATGDEAAPGDEPRATGVSASCGATWLGVTCEGAF